MKKELYETPELEIVKFMTVDVITDSDSREEYEGGEEQLP